MKQNMPGSNQTDQMTSFARLSKFNSYDITSAIFYVQIYALVSSTNLTCTYMMSHHLDSSTSKFLPCSVVNLYINLSSKFFYVQVRPL
jgi:hypothetical protein